VEPVEPEPGSRGTIKKPNKIRHFLLGTGGTGGTGHFPEEIFGGYKVAECHRVILRKLKMPGSTGSTGSNMQVMPIFIGFS
jgi:hypothetical protein